MGIEEYAYVQEAAREVFGEAARISTNNESHCTIIEVPEIRVEISHPPLKLDNVLKPEEGEVLDRADLPFGNDLIILAGFKKQVRDRLPVEFEKLYEMVCRHSGYMFISKPDLDGRKTYDWSEIIFERGDLNYLRASCSDLVECHKKGLAEMLVKPYPLISEKLHNEVNFIGDLEHLFRTFLKRATPTGNS